VDPETPQPAGDSVRLEAQAAGQAGVHQAARDLRYRDGVGGARLGQPLAGHTNYVNTVAFSADGHTLATGSNDQTVRLWNVTDPTHPAQLGQPLTDHTDNVAAGGVQPRRAHPGHRRRRHRPHDSAMGNEHRPSDPADLHYYREHPHPGDVGAACAGPALSPTVPLMPTEFDAAADPVCNRTARCAPSCTVSVSHFVVQGAMASVDWRTLVRLATSPSSLRVWTPWLWEPVAAVSRRRWSLSS
jgi:hypothetical protein